MSNYEMYIQSALGDILFDITPKFFPRMQFAWKRSGHEVNVVDSLPVEGWFSENDPAVLWTKWNLLRNIAHSGRPATVTFRISPAGAVLYKFTRGHILNLVSKEEGGGFVNHINFTFDVEEERAVRIPGIVDVTRSDEQFIDTDFVTGKVKYTLRREASATGQNGDLVAPYDFVVAQRPTWEGFTRESIKKVEYDGIVTGVWEYETPDISSNGEPIELKMRLWRERVTRAPGERSSRFYRTGGAPVLIRGGLGTTRIDADGHVETYDVSAMPGPSDIVNGIISQATNNVTDVVTDIKLGAVYVAKWKRKTPTSKGGGFSFGFGVDGELGLPKSEPSEPADDSVPQIWGMDYNVSCEFGESGPDRGEWIRPFARKEGGPE
jgi:hypothetical protein